jgi:ribosomal protein L31E
MVFAGLTKPAKWLENLKDPEEMGKNFEKAMAALKQLPAEERERISAEFLTRLDDRSKWDDLVNTHQAYDWLKKNADMAVREFNKVARKLSGGMVNVPFDNLLRESSYWKGMDKLPEEVRVMAEKTYAIWRDDPKNPLLRFKKIHPSQPIYSFRVGLAYRTIGVDSDGRLIWFWVGSFDEFSKEVAKKN